MAKTDAEIAILIRACRQTVAGLLFVFVDHGAGIRRATYLCFDCKERGQKREYNLFIIHVNFDHAWAEHLMYSPDPGFFREILQERHREYFQP